MSGFFLVRRTCLDLVSLHPQGFMLLLELLVHCPQATVAEVPYTFARHSRVSKIGIKGRCNLSGLLATLGPDMSCSAEAAASVRPGSRGRGSRRLLIGH